ncbi:MAG: SRPBCC family protein [Anaerolineales bacterium]
MINFENSIRIERPASEVFEFVADFENLPKWNYYVLKVEKISSGPAGVGTTYHQVRKNDQQRFAITEYQPHSQVTIETLPGEKPQLEMRLSLQPDGAATLLNDEWKLDMGVPGLIEKLAAGRVKGAVAENLEMLKDLLEAGRVELQDGRVVQH